MPEYKVRNSHGPVVLENTSTSNLLLVIGGQQKYLRPFLADDENWYEYHKGLVLKLDPEAETSETVVEHSSPPEARTENGVATLFKSATLKDGKLYTCTQTEILIYKLPRFEPIGYISLPSFNDVHHVLPMSNGNLAVASAGLDMVIEVTEDGHAVREWGMTGEDAWNGFSRNLDYRRVNTKPHKAHPNHLFYVDDELWVTRFHLKDAISLSNPKRRIEIGIGTPHDGVVRSDHIFFTTVNGFIVIANKNTLRTEEIIDLNAIHNYGGPLGWCRGIHFAGTGKMWLGFSRIRPTKLRENVAWAKRNLKWRLARLMRTRLGTAKWIERGWNRELPSRLALYDLTKRKCLAEVNMEPHGISAIFSILSAENSCRTERAFTEQGAL